MILHVLIAMVAGCCSGISNRSSLISMKKIAGSKRTSAVVAFTSRIPNDAALRRWPTRLAASACTRWLRWSRQTPFYAGIGSLSRGSSTGVRSGDRWADHMFPRRKRYHRC